MARSEVNLEQKIEKILDVTPGQPIIELANKMKVNRTFLAGYLQALEDRGGVTSRKIGPAKVYFNGNKLQRELKREG